MSVAGFLVGLLSLPAVAAPLDLDAQRALVQGRWTHTVPLDLPSAPVGTGPSMALTYRGDVGDGPLGIGWGLTGLERIERRGPAGGAATLSGVDTFELGGQRLYWTSGPGQAGYRLEVDDNRIFTFQAETVDESDHNYWVAQRDGWTWWYGEIPAGASWQGVCGTETPGELPCDSHPGQTRSPDGTVAWNLVRIEDPAGNVVRFEYTAADGWDGATGASFVSGGESEHRLATVWYNDDSVRVRLAWESRPDVRTTMRGGVPWVDATRLDALVIEAWDGASWQEQSTYDVAWLDEDLGVQACRGETLPAVDEVTVSYLHRVTRTAPGLSQELMCAEWDLATTTFDTSPVEVEGEWAPAIEGSQLVPMPMDWDGDGFPTMGGYWLDGDGDMVGCDVPLLCDLTSTGNVVGMDAGEIRIVEGGYGVTDLDGDARMDLWYTFQVTGTQREFWRKTYRNGVPTAEYVIRSSTAADYPVDEAHLEGATYVDIDGDGLADLVTPDGWVPNAGAIPFYREADWIDTTSDPGWYLAVANDWVDGLVLDNCEYGTSPVEQEDYADPACAPPSGTDVAVTQALEAGESARLLINRQWSDFNGDGVADFLLVIEGGDRTGDVAAWYAANASGSYHDPSWSRYSQVWLGDGTGGFISAPWCEGDDNCLGWAVINPEDPDESAWLLGDLDRDHRTELFDAGATASGYGGGRRWVGEVWGFGGASVQFPTLSTDDAILCYEEEGTLVRTSRLLMDADQDGYQDLYEITWTPGNGDRSDRWYRNLTTRPRGRVTRIHNPWGGATELEWGLSAMTGDSPDLPYLVDVVTSVDDEHGHTTFAYGGGSFWDGRFRGFSDVIVGREDGGSTFLKYAVSPAFEGREVWRSEHRADGSIARVAYHHFMRPSGHTWYFDDEPPYYNPEWRSCVAEVGPGVPATTGAAVQSTNVQAIVTSCTEAFIPTDFAGRGFAVAYGWERWPTDSVPLSTLATQVWVPNGQQGGQLLDAHASAALEWTPYDIPAGTGSWPELDHAPPVGVAMPLAPTPPTPAGGSTTEIRLELTISAYDADQRPTKVEMRRDPSTTADDRTREWTYYPWSSSDAGKDVQSVKERDSSGTSRTSTYSGLVAFGLASTIAETGTGPYGTVTRSTAYTYDHGNVATVAHPDGSTESFTRNACGAVTHRVDGAGRSEDREFDLSCRETRRSWEGAVVETDRDGFGRLVARRTTPIAGGDLPVVAESWVYDDVIDTADVRDAWGEPRQGRRLEGGPGLEDDRLELTYVDPWGRVTLAEICGDSGVYGTDAAALVRTQMACDDGRARARVWRGWATDGTPRGVSRPYEPDDTDVASSWTYYDAVGDLVAEQAPAPDPGVGRWVTTTRVRTPGDVTVTDPMGMECTEAWTTTSRQASCGGISRGSTTTDAWGQAVAELDGEGHGFLQTWDAFGRRRTRTLNTSITTEDGAVQPSWSWTWDSMHRVATEAGPAGAVLTWFRDGAGRPTSTWFTPGSLGGASATVNAWTWYDWSGVPGSRRVRREDQNGAVSWTWLDGLDRDYQRLDPDGAATVRAWDALGQVDTLVDRDAVPHTFEYDSLGGLAAHTVAGAWVNEFFRDAAGQVQAEVDPDGVTTEYDYAWNGAPLGAYRPYGTTGGVWTLSQTSYRDDGRVAAEWRDGVDVEYGYDGLGRRDEACWGGDCTSWLQREAWAYDGADRVVWKTVDAALDSAGPSQTAWSYNAAGWLTEEEDAYGQAEVRKYDRVGNLRRVIDRDGVESAWAYDGWGRPTSADLAASGVWTYAYTFGTAQGEEHVAYAPDGGVWTTWYDGLGRAWKEETPDGTGVERHYLGDRLAGVDHLASGGGAIASEQYTYDARGRVLSEWGPKAGPWDPALAPGAGDYAFLWSYDDGAAGDGEVETTRVAPDGESTRWTVRDGVLVEEDISTPSAGSRLTRTWSYGVDFPRLEGELVEGGGAPPRESALHYDELGRVVTSEVATGARSTLTTRAEFDAFGTPGVLERATDGAPESSYVQSTDLNGRLVGVQATHESVVLGTVTYGYTAAGRPEVVSTSWAGGVGYAYDAGTGLVESVWDETFTTRHAGVTHRDAMGRPTRLTTGASGVVTWTWDGNGRVATWSATDGSAIETRSWSYDDRSRPVEVEHDGTGGYWREVRAYGGGSPSWGEEPGWLVEELRIDGTGTVTDARSYDYDVGGNRVRTSEWGTPVHEWTYDGSFLETSDGVGVTWSLDELTTDGRGTTITPSADGTEGSVATGTTSYGIGRDPWGRPAWTDDGSAVREQVWGNPGAPSWPLAGVDETGASTLTVALDGMVVGVVTDGVYASGVTDPSGNVVFLGGEWLGSPDAFGAAASAPTTSTFRHVYGGLEVLPGTGGYQLAQHRLYDGTSGRFTRTDPLGLAGGRHRFTYAENDPTTLWDPSGLSASGCGGGELSIQPESFTDMIPAERASWGHEGEVPLVEAREAAQAGIDATAAAWLDRVKEDVRGQLGVPPISDPPDPSLPGGPARDGLDAMRRWAPGLVEGLGDETPEGQRTISDDGTPGEAIEVWATGGRDYLAFLRVAFSGSGGLSTAPGWVHLGPGWGTGVTAGDLADAWEKKRGETRRIMEGWVEDPYAEAPDLVRVVVATTVMTAVDTGAGTVDSLRLGQGCAEGAVGCAQDAFRALSLVGDLGGAAAAAGKLGAAGKAATVSRSSTAAAEAEALLEGACFVGGTPVRTLTGTDTIDDVEVGDVVLAFEPTWRGVRQDRPPLSTVVLALGLGALPLASVAPAERFVWAGVVWELDGDTLVGTGEVAGTVVATSVHAATALVDVVVVSTAGGEEVVSATAEHPFYVEGVGWVAAGSLAPGDELTFAGQGRAWVVATTVRHGRFEVYNFEVADAHTYFVGADGAVLVHNGCASRGGFPKDFPTKATNNWSARYASEGEARALARQKIGRNPIEVEPGKWRSADGKWQYRAKPGDVSDNHIHLEELNPETGEVLQNVHLRWE